MRMGSNRPVNVFIFLQKCVCAICKGVKDEERARGCKEHMIGIVQANGYSSCLLVCHPSKSTLLSVIASFAVYYNC